MGRLPVEQNHHHHHHHQDHGRGHQPFSVFFGPGLSSHTSHSQSRWRWTVVRCCHCTGGGRGEGGGSLPACSNIARLHVEKKAHNTTGGTKMPRFTIQPWSFQDLLLLLRRRRRQVLPSIKAGCSVPILAFSSGARPVGGAVLLLSPPPPPRLSPLGLGSLDFIWISSRLCWQARRHRLATFGAQPTGAALVRPTAQAADSVMPVGRLLL